MIMVINLTISIAFDHPHLPEGKKINYPLNTSLQQAFDYQ